MFARRRLLNNQGLQLLLYVHNEHTHTHRFPNAMSQSSVSMVPIKCVQECSWNPAVAFLLLFNEATHPEKGLFCETLHVCEVYLVLYVFRKLESMHKVISKRYLLNQEYINVGYNFQTLLKTCSNFLQCSNNLKQGKSSTRTFLRSLSLFKNNKVT